MPACSIFERANVKVPLESGTSSKYNLLLGPSHIFRKFYSNLFLTFQINSSTHNEPQTLTVTSPSLEEVTKVLTKGDVPSRYRCTQTWNTVPIHVCFNISFSEKPLNVISQIPICRVFMITVWLFCIFCLLYRGFVV